MTRCEQDCHKIKCVFDIFDQKGFVVFVFEYVCAKRMIDITSCCRILWMADGRLLFAPATDAYVGGAGRQARREHNHQTRTQLHFRLLWDFLPGCFPYLTFSIELFVCSALTESRKQERMFNLLERREFSVLPFGVLFEYADSLHAQKCIWHFIFYLRMRKHERQLVESIKTDFCLRWFCSPGESSFNIPINIRCFGNSKFIAIPSS